MHTHWTPDSLHNRFSHPALPPPGTPLAVMLNASTLAELNHQWDEVRRGRCEMVVGLDEASLDLDVESFSDTSSASELHPKKAGRKIN